MHESLQPIFDEWKFYRQMTVDLLDSLPENALSFSVGEGMGILAKQFRHLGDIELCYVEALRFGVMDFSRQRKDYSIESSKDRLREFLFEIDDALSNTLEMIELEKTIAWGEEQLSLAEHLSALVHHETLHQGELIVYVRVQSLSFPPSWSAWGLA